MDSRNGRDLRPLFEPRSLAIVGASNDRAKWGNWLARGALRGEDRRRVFLVNRGGGEILGRPAFRSVAELPEPPELVVIAVPAAGFEDTVDASLAAGARALVGITAGLGESGPGARARERALVDRVRSAGAVLLGPNCLGLSDSTAGLDLTSNELPPGSIGLISQSGNLALELGMLAADASLGFSRFASIGNQADLDAAELVAAFARHEPTRVIALYVEDFRDGRAFARAAAASVAAGKPVVLLAIGRSEASARAARSHTGALVSDVAVVDAACRAAGAFRVTTPAELVDVAQALACARRPSGRRVAVVTDGGGHGAIAADVAAAHGLVVPPIGGDVRAEIAAELPATAATGNPVDFAGGGERDFWSYERVLGTLLRSDDVDAVLFTGYFGGYSQYGGEFAATEVAVADAIGATVAETGGTLVVHTMHAASAPAAALRRGGVPVYRRIESAARALAALAVDTPAVPPPAVPPPAAPAAVEGYFAARELLAAAGVPFVPARRVETADAAHAAADELGFPVVLKAIGALHKSDGGGVAVGLAGHDALAAALASMTARLAPAAFSVEAMAPLDQGVELIVGARWDAAFGPVAMVGAGGVHAELFGDVAVALAPVDEAGAAELLARLRGAPLLAGVRGRPPLDLPAAAAAAAAVSRLAAIRPDLADVEVNPLLVLPTGVLALDARVVPAAR
jgi:acyl-CoA synthetase (NDP forming)